MKIAIIDLGTNTFNLLIAESFQNGQYKILFKDKVGVKLGKGGINNKIITKDAFERGINGISYHLKSIDKYKADKIVATATSGIRSAQNGNDFVKSIEEKFRIRIQVISGDDEAELIYRGVKQAVQFENENVLILDIGGGSNEFIIANSSGLLWKKSFPLGIARLLDQFNPSDPIKADEIEMVEQYIDSQLNPLFEACKEYQPLKLIGCSGTFDSIRSMIVAKNANLSHRIKKNTFFEIDLKDYDTLHRGLLNSTLDERLRMKGLEPIRVEMIVLASIFVNFIINKLKIKSLTQSAFAIKEGVLDKVLNG